MLSKQICTLKNLNEPLYKNSLYLMLTMISGTGSGFIFWLIAAKYYNPEDIGLAVATISAINLLSIFTRFGFEIGIIRYLPHENNKSSMINSCISTIILFSILVGFIFICGLDVFSPKLLFLRDSMYLIFLFVIFTVSSSLFPLQNNIYVAFRNTKYSFYQSLICMSRILALPILVSIGFFGVYLAYGFGILTSVIFGIFFINKVYPSYRLYPYVENSILNKMIHFSFGNYIAIILETLPNFLLPILIVNSLGAEINAYYYIAWSFSGILLMVPKATATSLFAEGLYSKRDLFTNTMKTLRFAFILIVPMILGIFLFGDYMLSVFGREYSEYAFGMLKMFSLASLSNSLNIIYISIKRVNKEINSVIFINFILAFFTIIGGYFLMNRIGLIGIGVAWLLANLFVNLLIAIKTFKFKKNLIDFYFGSGESTAEFTKFDQ